MSGMIRRGIVAPLAVVLGVALIAPGAQAQTEAELKRISSAYERAKFEFRTFRSNEIRERLSVFSRLQSRLLLNLPRNRLVI